MRCRRGLLGKGSYVPSASGAFPGGIGGDGDARMMIPSGTGTGSGSVPLSTFYPYDLSLCDG